MLPVGIVVILICFFLLDETLLELIINSCVYHIQKVQTEVEKVPFSEYLEDFGLLLVENLPNHLKTWMKRLNQVVASSMFLSDPIHAWEH